jgi:uncharacterized protein
MAAVTRLGPEGHVRVPWKNGGGESLTIAGERLPGAAPGDWSGVIWQLSRTPILTPGPFSDLPGFERLQVVVKGDGLMLDTPAGAIDLRKPLSVARYDGGTPIVSRLLNGPVEVVNLIARRTMAMIDLRVLGAGERLASGAGLHVAYAPMEAATLDIDGSTFDVAPDHGLSFAGSGLILCRTGRSVLATVQRIPAS